MQGPDEQTIIGDVSVVPDTIALARCPSVVFDQIASGAGLSTRTIMRLRPPEWMRFPVNSTTGEVILPALLFMLEVRGRSSGRSQDTMEALAYDLRNWFEFLALEGVAWPQADQCLLDDLLLDMAADGLAASTIKRQASTVGHFYKHAVSMGYACAKFSATLASGIASKPGSAVRPMLPEDIKSLLAYLSSLDDADHPQAKRLILAIKLAFYVGLRRVEICGLTFDQFTAFRYDPDQPFAEYPIELQVTKGSLIRWVMIPGHLVRDIQQYIVGPRAAVVEKLDGRASNALFLNQASASRNPGGPLSRASLSRDFRNAVDAVDLKRRNRGHAVGMGRSARRHTLHDLRHSCACAYFSALRETCADVAAAVQQKLGHALPETTTKVYLAYVDEFATPCGGTVQAAIHGLLH